MMKTLAEVIKVLENEIQFNEPIKVSRLLKLLNHIHACDNEAIIAFNCGDVYLDVDYCGSNPQTKDK